MVEPAQRKLQDIVEPLLTHEQYSFLSYNHVAAKAGGQLSYRFMRTAAPLRGQQQASQLVPVLLADRPQARPRRPRPAAFCLRAAPRATPTTCSA